QAVTPDTGPAPGGGVATAMSTPPQVLNTIIAQNYSVSAPPPPSKTPPDVEGTFKSLGHNLIGTATGSSGFTNGRDGDLVGGNGSPLYAGLMDLGNAGGFTLTHALLGGSPAITGGSNTVVGPPYNLTTDQRGKPRMAQP